MKLKISIVLFYIAGTSGLFAQDDFQEKPAESPWKIYLDAGIGIGAGDYRALSRWTAERNAGYHSYLAQNDSDYAGDACAHGTPGNAVMAMDYAVEAKLFYHNFGAGFGFGRGGFSSGENSFITDDAGDVVLVMRNRFIVYSYTVNLYYRHRLSPNGKLYLFPYAGVNYNTARYSYKITPVKYDKDPPFREQFEAVYRGSAFSWNAGAGIGYDFDLITAETVLRIRIGEINNMKSHNVRMRFADGTPVSVNLNYAELVFNVGVHY
jgi:hypothetical protein